MKKTALGLIALFAFLPSLSTPGREYVREVSQPSQTRYDSYSNARYRYSIAYPAGILVPQGESENGDGQRFASRDGKAMLTVWGAQRMDKSLREEYNDAMSNRKVTYKAIRTDWFVVSGFENGKIFYQKTLIRGSVFKTFILEYDETGRSEFDQITKRVARSFRG